MSAIYKNQTLLIFEFEAGSSLVGFTSALIKLKKPNRTSGEWVGTISDEENGIVTYEVQSEDDLNVAGEWIVWLDLTYNDGKKLISEPDRFTVFNPGTI